MGVNFQKYMVLGVELTELDFNRWTKKYAEQFINENFCYNCKTDVTTKFCPSCGASAGNRRDVEDALCDMLDYNGFAAFEDYEEYELPSNGIAAAVLEDPSLISYELVFVGIIINDLNAVTDLERQDAVGLLNKLSLPSDNLKLHVGTYYSY